jgi:hypothetical protein
VSGFATPSFQTSSSSSGRLTASVEVMAPSSHTPLSPAASDPMVTDDQRVGQTGRDAFPDSDPPAWTADREWRPSYPLDDPDDPDGGQARERERRRRHID